MSVQRAKQLRRYVAIKDPPPATSLQADIDAWRSRQRRTVRAFKRWWGELSADARRHATILMDAHLLPVSERMTTVTPGAPPPKKRRKR